MNLSKIFNFDSEPQQAQEKNPKSAKNELIRKQLEELQKQEQENGNRKEGQKGSNDEEENYLFKCGSGSTVSSHKSIHRRQAVFTT